MQNIIQMIENFIKVDKKMSSIRWNIIRIVENNEKSYENIVRLFDRSVLSSRESHGFLTF